MHHRIFCKPLKKANRALKNLVAAPHTISPHDDESFNVQLLNSYQKNRLSYRSSIAQYTLLDLITILKVICLRIQQDNVLNSPLGRNMALVGNLKYD